MPARVVLTERVLAEFTQQEIGLARQAMAGEEPVGLLEVVL